MYLLTINDHMQFQIHLIGSMLILHLQILLCATMRLFLKVKSSLHIVK